MADVIEIERLTKDYGKGRGIFDLSLRVRKGEVFGFLGPNGAGKTTTIRILMDFIRATRGSARIMGHDVRDEGLLIRKHVGYLPGELAMYSSLKGETILRRIEGLRSIDRHHVRRLVRRLNADLDRPVGQLSSGNKRKIGLIMALAHDPDVLILDEPTTGLDPLMQREIHGLIRQAARDGKTVFVSSHFLPEVERICDRVGIVREGRLLVTKPLAELTQDRINRLVFRFDGPAPVESFRGIPGIRNMQTKGPRLRIEMDGPVDAVIKAAAQHTVLDVESQDPDLEEIFLDYYRRPLRA